ncbi:MAG: hypothetical protein KJ645_13780 [Planctomycetes bacterium]|nr:hypothetical protein [Planctomycetota bacterium]
MAKNQNSNHPLNGLWGRAFVGPGFLLVAAWFLWGGTETSIPQTEAKMIRSSLLTVEPLRRPLQDPPLIWIDGFQRTCMDCHRLFPARRDPPAQLFQHTHIRIDHGINDRCRNCHDLRDRDRLVLQSGETISFPEVVRLCAGCHGPVFRDWERGMHGRTNGFWDRSRGPQHRLGCTECHDPHQPRHPAMDPLKPLPPPDTLRMGLEETPQQHEEATEHDPLRRAIQRTDRIRAAGREDEGV